MHSRKGTKRDREKIKKLHAEAGYGFSLPKGLRFDVVEEDGEIVAVAGFEMVAQVVAVVNPAIKSPVTRLRSLKMLHGSLAPKALKRGVKSVYVFCDPQAKNFGNRLRRLGWSRKNWPCLFLERDEIKKVFG